MSDQRNRSNVLVGAPDIKVSGGITVGPAVKDPQKFPKTVDDDLSSLGHKPVGYVSEDGVSKSIDRSTEKIKDWNGDTVKMTQSEYSVTLSITLIEAANAEVLKMVAGDKNVTEQGDIIRVVDNADELPHRSIAIHMDGGDGGKILMFAPDAQVTEVGEVAYLRSDVIKYQVTIECYAVDNQPLIQLVKKGATNESDLGTTEEEHEEENSVPGIGG